METVLIKDISEWHNKNIVKSVHSKKKEIYNDKEQKSYQKQNAA